MKRQLTFGQYRMIDLCMMLAMLVLFESIIVLAAGTWFPNTLYTVSIVASVTAIVMVRWDFCAALFAFAGGLVLCVLSHGTGEQFLIYCLGNELSMAAFFVMKLLTKERIKQEAVMAVLFGICVQLLMQAGRALAALCLGYAAKDCLGFFSTDSLSILFTMVILWIARRQDGLLEDQRVYLHRIREEERAERGDAEPWERS